MDIYNKLKNVDFFVIPGNLQVLLGIPDTDALNIIKTRMPVGLKLSPLKTSFLAAV